MAVKGTIAKKELTDKILQTVDGSFINGKELRIPWMENGELVEIKVTFTCAKDVLRSGSVPSTPTTSVVDVPQVSPAPAAMTDNEKANVKKLATSLGLL